jgi:hypothetical protein
MMIGMAAVASLPAHHAAHLETVDMRQHQVEHDQLRRPDGDRLQRFAARCCALGDKPRLVEISRHEFGDIRIVLDDQDARRHERHSTGDDYS